MPIKLKRATTPNAPRPRLLIRSCGPMTAGLGGTAVAVGGMGVNVGAGVTVGSGVLPGKSVGDGVGVSVSTGV